MESGINEYFSLYEQLKPINDNINLTFTPDSNVTSYKYEIYKNESLIKEYEVLTNESAFISLNTTGNYQIKVYETINEEQKEILSGIYKIDKNAPVIEVDSLLVEMQQGAILDIMGGVKAFDTEEGDITAKITTNASSLDFTTIGLKKLIYSVSDEAGNTTTRTVNINVLKGTTSSLIAVQTVIIAVLIIFSLVILYLKRSINLEKRIAKYSIEPINDKSVSLFDKLLNKYYKFLVKVKKIIGDLKTLQKYSKKYDKYVNVVNKIYKDGMDFVTNKIIVSFIFIFIAIFSKTIQYELLKFYEICLPLLVGFFIPDIVYAYSFKRHCAMIENDLLQAIMIMNNAFKSGRSITQAIYLVTTELDGPVAEEFKKVYMEINLGLSIEVAFERLKERVPVDEVSYLTASISILNKTGGNIIKVFTSIEKTLFNKKKLKLELASLTGSSRVISYVLFAVPVLFILFITLLDPTYFVPFFTTSLGFILLIIMLVIYALYIIVVMKIMKVRLWVEDLSVKSIVTL